MSDARDALLYAQGYDQGWRDASEQTREALAQAMEKREPELAFAIRAVPLPCAAPIPTPRLPKNSLRLPQEGVGQGGGGDTDAAIDRARGEA